jgi:aminoglycoside phosphotransferase (APT) family kinase protein
MSTPRIGVHRRSFVHRQTVAVAPPDDPELVLVLRSFEIQASDLLGHGGEARVYALGPDRVLRVLHPGGRAEDMARRQDLVGRLARSRPAFALPEILEVGQVGERIYVIERRLPGVSVQEALRTCPPEGRTTLVERYLEAAATLGDLRLERPHTFGDLIRDDAITTSTWRAYLEQRAAASLSRSTGELRSVDPRDLAADLPEPAEPAFVHLDVFAGNMMTDGQRITAVIDVGSTSVAGDRRLDPLAAAVYLASPEITPAATAADVDVAMRWLGATGLDRWFEPARRWLAAYWSFAVDDANLLRWCQGVLLGR